MRYEKPQKGNPHKLTINQHVFPLKSISRFIDKFGFVQTYIIKPKKIKKLKPSNKIFCARRVWNERAEAGFMKHIEDKYQALADAILDGRQADVTLLERDVVSEMFALWNIREHRKSHPIPDQKLNGVQPSVKLGKNDLEMLEKNYILSMGPDSIIKGRDMAGIGIQRDINRTCENMLDAEWGVLTSTSGEFVVPDNFSNARILPLSPTKCLFSKSESKHISSLGVREINRLALQSCNEYWFARDISKCPI